MEPAPCRLHNQLSVAAVRLVYMHDTALIYLIAKCNPGMSTTNSHVSYLGVVYTCVMYAVESKPTSYNQEKDR